MVRPDQTTVTVGPAHCGPNVETTGFDCDARRRRGLDLTVWLAALAADPARETSQTSIAFFPPMRELGRAKTSGGANNSPQRPAALMSNQRPILLAAREGQ